MAEGIDPDFLLGFFDRMLEAVRSQDPNQVAALCTEDVVFDDAGPERLLVGREALIELLGALYKVADDIEVEIIDRYVSLESAVAAARWQTKGTLRDPAGRPARLETAEFYEFRDGLISHWTFMVRDRDWLGRQWGG